MKINSTEKLKEQVTQLLGRVRAAKESGLKKKADYWARRYLNSFAAKYLAVRRANSQLKLPHKLKKADLKAIAEGLDAWKGSQEEVLVHLKRKPSNPNYFRTYMVFGIENRALQYLILPLLKQLVDLVTYQYTIRGGTRAAIKHAVKAMSAGPVWAFELDVNDCYRSFDGEKLASYLASRLLVPKEVSERVLISEYLNLKGGNISYHFGPTGDDDPGDPVSLEETLVEARRGIPQGSAASSLIAETMLAIALREVPELGAKVAYGDNCLLIAKELGDAVTMKQALMSALKAHPVGLLWPKWKPFELGQPVEFLGHSLTFKSEGKVRIDPSPKNKEKFEAIMVAKLNYLQFAKLGPAARARAYRELKRYVRSWTAAFSLCKGIGDFRMHWLNKIAAAFPLAA